MADLLLLEDYIFCGLLELYDWIKGWWQPAIIVLTAIYIDPFLRVERLCQRCAVPALFCTA